MRLTLDKYRVIRALRLIFSLVAGTLISYHLAIPMSGWVMVTSTVVLFDQDTVGGTINKGKMRLLATLYAAAISFTSMLLFAHHPYIIWTIVIVSIFGYAYYYMGSKNSYIGVLGVVTIAILLVSNHNLELTTALYRLIDILLGVAIALLSMVIIYPQYAHQKAQTLLAVSLNDMAHLLKCLLKLDTIEAIRGEILKVETKFITDVANFNKNLDEAKHEIKVVAHPEIIDYYSQSILGVRRLYRLLLVIFYYELEDLNLSDTILRQMLTHLIQVFEQIIQHRDPKPTIQALTALLPQLADASLNKTFGYFITELLALAETCQALREPTKLVDNR
jgi:uncharacterized membrane protein YccC